MGELFIIFLAVIILDIISVIMLFSKKGKFVKDSILMYIISIYGLILAYIQYTSGPSNDILTKVLSLFYVVCFIGSLILKKNNFYLSRLLLGFSLICSTITVFFI
ncbi:hypothetical protein [Romboutsia sp. Marseille-P6047]|uniref:hypothetical protein n=1 Tax=Romboutsia sp. Marseille-P6047 TaxID=2161817 RepID=UPI000F04A4FE|nr:hypothetical protein [Romboutsia sp. Marseille-P6047]